MSEHVTGSQNVGFLTALAGLIFAGRRRNGTPPTDEYRHRCQMLAKGTAEAEARLRRLEDRHEIPEAEL